jgi:hypothetical protein
MSRRGRGLKLGDLSTQRCRVCLCGNAGDQVCSSSSGIGNSSSRSAIAS